MGTVRHRATRTTHRRPRPLSRSLAVAMLALASMAAAGCEYLGESKAKSAAPAPAPPLVQVIEASPRTVMLQSEWVAQTYSQDTVEVRARVTGYIEQRRFNAGDLVKQGDILYNLDDRPYKAQVDRAKGDLDQRQADLQFAKEQVQVLEAQAQLEQARAEMLRQQINVNRLVPLVAADAAPSAEPGRRAPVPRRRPGDLRSPASEPRPDQDHDSDADRRQARHRRGRQGRSRRGRAELRLRHDPGPDQRTRRRHHGRGGRSRHQHSAQPLTTIIPLDPISVKFNVSEIEYLNYIQSGGTREAGRQIPLRLVLADGRVFPREGRIKRESQPGGPADGHAPAPGRLPEPRWADPGRPVRADSRPRARAEGRSARAPEGGRRAAGRAQRDGGRAREQGGPAHGHDGRPHRRALDRHRGPPARGARDRGGAPEGSARHGGEAAGRGIARGQGRPARAPVPGAAVHAAPARVGRPWRGSSSTTRCSRW